MCTHLLQSSKSKPIETAFTQEIRHDWIIFTHYFSGFIILQRTKAGRHLYVEHDFNRGMVTHSLCCII